MDEYLESLVLKTDEEPAVDEVIEEPVEVAEETNVAEEPVEDVAANDGENEVVAEDDKEDTKEEPEQAIAPESQPAATSYEIDQTYSVSEIKIFNVPDISQPSIIFTGNVVYKGKLDQFSVVDFVRNGYGLVRGYAIGL